MKITESQIEFDLDQKYSDDLKSFLKNIATTRIKGFIENFLEKDLKERKKAEFKDFKQEFEEYINCGEVVQSDISKFSLEEKITICQFVEDRDMLSLRYSKLSYYNLIPKISYDSGLALNYLINEASFDFVIQLEKSMKEMKLKIWELPQNNSAKWK